MMMVATPGLAPSPCQCRVLSQYQPQQHKVKTQQNSPTPRVSLCLLLSRNIECRGEWRLIYLNVWVDGFSVSLILDMKSKAMNISDCIKIEFGKRWTTSAREARTKSNVNGRRLILRTWTKSRMTKPVSFTIPERQLEIVSSGPILAILTVNTPCSCCVLSCCPLSSSGMVIVNNMGTTSSLFVVLVTCLKMCYLESQE